MCGLLIISVLHFVAQCVAQQGQATAKYKTYENYSAVEYDNQTGTFTPTAMDCMGRSTAQPATNGAVYNYATHMCVVMDTNNNQIGLTLHANDGYVTYVKDISKVQKVLAKFQGGLTSTPNPPLENIGGV